MSSGFIKLSRNILDWHWYNDANTLKVFIHLLLKANYKDGYWRDLELKRGQCVIGRTALSRELCMTEQVVRTSINRLIKSGELSSKSTNRFTTITVIKYSSYQGLESDLTSNQPADNQQITSNQPADNQQITSNQPADNQQITTSKEGKERKEGNNIKKRAVFKKPSIEEIQKHLTEKGITSFTAEKFFYHYEANGWFVGKNKMKSWTSAVTTWKIRADEQVQKTSAEERKSTYREFPID